MMVNSLPLDGLIIIDLTHRLPGPLATKLLADQGARVIKVEDEKFGDPFEDGFFKEIDPSFSSWYRELNQQKEVIKVDFNSEAGVKKVHDLILKSDGLISALPEKIKLKLQLSDSLFENVDRPFVFLSLIASLNGPAVLHDLNVIVRLGLIDMHLGETENNIIAPPLLPIAGAGFASQIALSFCSNYIKAVQKNSTIKAQVPLLESCEKLYRPLYSKELMKSGQSRFLHNGLFPCYCIYKLKDGNYLAIAAIEEKIWTKLNNLLKLNLEASKRFLNDPENFQSLANKIITLSSKEVSDSLGGHDLCADIIYSKPSSSIS